jgi:sRNA-binding carbon storage regulator CsrA
MLVLQRQEQEKIVIVVPPSTGERFIEVQLVRVTSKRCARIAIQAPSDCSIDRKEVWESKQREKKATVKS